jgi:hypothetical protein
MKGFGVRDWVLRHCHVALRCCQLAAVKAGGLQCMVVALSWHTRESMPLSVLLLLVWQSPIINILAG